MKKFVFIPLIASVVSACGAPQAPRQRRSMTQEETNQILFHYNLAHVCMNEGQVSNKSEVVAYIREAQALLRNHSTPERGNIAANDPVISVSNIQKQVRSDPKYCRYLEKEAIIRAQQKSEQKAQAEERERRIAEENRIQAEKTKMPNYGYPAAPRPTTVYCNHYQWGNMTACNAF